MLTRKSHAASFICTLVFGPLGIAYASLWQAFVVCAVYLVAGVGLIARDNTDYTSSIASAGVGLMQQAGWTALFAWFVPILIGAAAVKFHNEDVLDQDRETERRHRELIQAIRGM